MEEVKAYCMKCKAERVMQNVQIVTTKNGRPAANGVCPVCGTKMFKFLPAAYKQQAAAQQQASTEPAQPAQSAQDAAKSAEATPVVESSGSASL